MGTALAYGGMEPIYMFRSEMELEKEKRQLFLRSYQFSRKVSVGERLKKSLFRVKRVMWVRLRSAGKLRNSLWLKLRNGLRRRKLRFLHTCTTTYYYKGVSNAQSSNCLW